MALFERFMNDSLSVAGDNPSEIDSPPVAPQRTYYAPSTVDDIPEDFVHQQRLNDDFSTASDSYEFHYGAEKPFIKSANTKVTIKTLATNLSNLTQTQVRETDITVFCNGKQVADNTFTPGNRYFVHFQTQPTPSAPEIDEHRFIVKTDVDKLRLSDCPLPLITVARVCQLLGNNAINYTVAPENTDGKLIFKKSLSASLQQVALKLSAAFVECEMSDAAINSKDTYNVIKALLSLTRQAENELVDILLNVLDGLNSKNSPDFELIKTSTAAQIKHNKRKNVPAREIVRNINIPSKNELAGWNLIDHSGDVITTRVKAYQTFDSVVLPLLKRAKDLVNMFSDEQLIQFLDTLIDIVYGVNMSFEKYLCLYHKVSSTKLENTSDLFPSIVEKFKTCYSIFRAVAPYGFINGPATYSELQKILEQAQLHYTIFMSNI